jgi:hypothetical protein
MPVGGGVPAIVGRMKNLAATGILLSSLLGDAALAAEGQLQIPQEIRAQCQPPNSALACEDVQEFLDAMNAESRDDNWAKAMEARIRKAMRVEGKDFVEVRELQCRRARCVLVYSHPRKDVDPQFDGDESLDKLMDVRTGAVGHETAPGGGSPKAVSLLAWQKRLIIQDAANPEDAVDARE